MGLSGVYCRLWSLELLLGATSRSYLGSLPVSGTRPSVARLDQVGLSTPPSGE